MYIAIDIGGTKIHLASLSELSPDKLIDEIVINTNEIYDISYKEIVKEINNLKGDDQIDGIGISLAAQFDKNNLITYATNIPDWDDKPLIDMLSKEFDTKVVGDNDAVTGGLAEIYFGGHNFDKIIYLIMGTGFGATFVDKSRDQVYTIAMEPGGMILDKNGWPKEGFKTQGLASAYLGGKSIADNSNKDLSKISDEDELWDEVIEKMTLAINNLTVNFRPEAVIVGGGLISKRPFLVEKVNQKLKNLDEYIDQPMVYLSKIDGNPSLLGTLALFK